MKKLLLLLALAAPVLFGLQSLKMSPPTPEAAADTLCFQRDIFPIINTNCAMSKCHDAITHAEGYNLTTYAGIMKGVKAGAPTSSKVYTEVRSNAMPQDRPALPDSLKEKIRLWIAQGAKNTACPPASCDSVNVAYATTIRTIIQDNCIGCHRPPTPEGGVNLTNELYITENIGLLECVVMHDADCVPMPPNGKLDVCQLAKVRKWAQSATSVDEQTPNAELAVMPSVVQEQATVRFTTTANGRVTLALYSAAGMEVLRVADADFAAGTHNAPLKMSALPHGVYLLKMTAGSRRVSAMVMH